MTVSKRYPKRSAGPSISKANEALKQPLLRIVFGDIREGRPAVSLRNSDFSATDSSMSIECAFNSSVSHMRRETACVSLDEPDLKSSAWVDFTFTRLADIYITFAVSSKHVAKDTNDYAPRGRENMGVAVVSGLELTDLKGVLDRPLLDDSFQVVGTLTLDYVVIKPFIYPESYTDALLDDGSEAVFKVPKFVGHRGMGKTNPNRVKENTLLSFLLATLDPNVSHVELDVQLSKDGKTIIYHDWFFRPHGRDKDPDSSCLRVAPYALRFDEFSGLYASGVREEEYKRLTAQEVARCIETISSDEDVQEFAAQDVLRSLYDVGNCLPPHVGLFVEAKYPPRNVQEDTPFPYPERNAYVDSLLHDIFRVKSNLQRSICFLSFDADVCMMLALKQNRFPVFFLNCETMDQPCEMLDPRCIDVHQGLHFARVNGLRGMVLFNELLEKDNGIVAAVKGSGLALLTYGGKNSIPERVIDQLQSGVEGVIADDIHDVVKEMKERFAHFSILQPEKKAQSWPEIHHNKRDSKGVQDNCDEAYEGYTL